MLLAGFDPRIVQSTCSQYTTLNAVTRESFDAAVERMRAIYSAKEVRDVTAPAITKKLKKLFGEV